MPRKPLVRNPGISPTKLMRARELRRGMTPQESLLWDRLRARRTGFVFRRQQVLAGFIVDFLCSAARVVVEVDGPVHDQQVEEDARRSAALRELGLTVIRFRNDEIETSLDEVVDRIMETCAQAEL